jgi:hypothetical protein
MGYPPVSHWKQSRFTDIRLCTIVQSYRPLRAALQFAPAMWLRSFGLGEFHVAQTRRIQAIFTHL